jgi:hypothetical protein
MKKRAKQAELAKIAQSEAPIALYQSKNKQIKAIGRGLRACVSSMACRRLSLNSCWTRTWKQTGSL